MFECCDIVSQFRACIVLALAASAFAGHIGSYGLGFAAAPAVATYHAVPAVATVAHAPISTAVAAPVAAYATAPVVAAAPAVAKVAAAYHVPAVATYAAAPVVAAAPAVTKVAATYATAPVIAAATAVTKVTTTHHAPAVVAAAPVATYHAAPAVTAVHATPAVAAVAHAAPAVAAYHAAPVYGYGVGTLGYGVGNYGFGHGPLAYGLNYGYGLGSPYHYGALLRKKYGLSQSRESLKKYLQLNVTASGAKANTITIQKSQRATSCDVVYDNDKRHPLKFPYAALSTATSIEDLYFLNANMDLSLRQTPDPSTGRWLDSILDQAHALA
ncbi:hypothetical protein HPB49_008962 [Dermacentor silvarum]|uniref:Uncharacterized protein n=1 Tax=Dermacentor silvarum TaxID=543639 RepID=A0ACB8D465_DERSI|nr:hypothetical protein HPB49_008962 [Dermacentor silvarum]